MGVDKVCYNCGKKVSAIFSKKCQDQFFCSGCMGKLHSYIVDNLDVFTPEQVSDFIVVSEAKDKMYQNEVLRKVLSERMQYLGWKRADEKDRKKLEAEYKRECDSLKRELERNLKEVEREQEEFKRSNHITETERAAMENVKQTIRNNYQKDARILAENFEIDKAELGKIAKKGSNKLENNENELNLIVWKAHNRARELRQQKVADAAEAQKKVEEQKAAKQRKMEEQRVAEEQKWAEEQKKAEEIALKKQEEEKRLNEQRKIDEEAKIEAQKQLQAELEEYKAEAREKALKEVREKERIKVENEAKRNLERELREKKKAELKQARKEDPVHLAWISLVCSILAWLTSITVLLPIIFIPVGLITGVKALKSSKRNVAIASIITSGIFVLIIIVVSVILAINS